MKDSYLTAGIKLDQLVRLLGRNKITSNPKTMLRVAFLIQSAVWSSFFSWIEAVRFSGKLKRFPEPKDPIFIIGHWRTGTTLLHQLMNLDPALSAPSLFQVAVPDSFLVSYPYYRPIFKRVVSDHRPMDQVKIGMDEPQEDEYAIYRITSFSPLERLVFPASPAYFLNHGSPFLPGAGDLPDWKDKVSGFYRKLSYLTKKRILSKNPFNSFRIPELLDMFPDARFIYMIRNPYHVVPSTVNMWSILQDQNSLNRRYRPPSVAEVASMFETLHETVQRDRKVIPPGKYAEVRFEELEANPLETLRKIYTLTGLTFSVEMEEKIRDFFKINASYKKNQFTLSPEEKQEISGQLSTLSADYGYDLN